jgi:hypothetical protein
VTLLLDGFERERSTSGRMVRPYPWRPRRERRRTAFGSVSSTRLPS